MTLDPGGPLFWVAVLGRRLYMPAFVLLIMGAFSRRAALETNAGLFATPTMKALWRSPWLKYVYPGSIAACVVLWVVLFMSAASLCNHNLDVFSERLIFYFPLFCTMPALILFLAANAGMSWLLSHLQPASLRVRTGLLACVPVITFLVMDCAVIGPISTKILQGTYGRAAFLSLTGPFCSALIPIILWGLSVGCHLRTDASPPTVESEGI